MKRQIVVVGAGAGGMMAAGRAAEIGADVLLLERTNRPGNKLRLTGNGRCNLTNTKDLDDFVDMYGPNGRFLYSAFQRFFRDDLLSLLGRYGVETKTQPDGRVFPASNRAEDVVLALQRYLEEGGVRLRNNARVSAICVNRQKVTGVEIGQETVPGAAVVLATGGASYPETGSSGDGYRLAAELGHTIVKLRPALVPLVVMEIDLAKSMQGIALKNVRLTAYQCEADRIDPSLKLAGDYGRGIAGRRPPKPVIESRTGEMMITHFGISGPITLLMSLAIVDALERGPVSVAIDLFPQLDQSQLGQRLQGEFDRYGKRSLRHLLDALLPHKLVDPLLEMAGLPPDRLGHQITALERERLTHLLKSLRFNVKAPLPIASATVTAGGVSLDEIDPKTMASRLVKGLYFCGEVLDLDADTGGYNLQAAFSTGWVAGEAAGQGVIARSA
ncbi:MAG: NAD(P)/FAD-dependent oxidoreductase [Dehalococcoidia bacterium]|nr:NAD(P)/FAD-dependent oxidoreductase [Dehalococcoidia bacterium]